MKPSEYPEQDARTVPFQSETKEAVLARPVPETRSRYVDVPVNEGDRGATRNLALGITFLCLAAIGCWLGYYYAGAAVVRTVVACLLTFAIIWLLLHLNVLRQRYGGLFGLGLVAFLGAAIPFVEGGFRRLDNIARERLAGETPSAAALTVPPPPPTAATAPPAPPTIPLPAIDPNGSVIADESSAPAPKGPSKVAAEPVAPKPKPELATKVGEDGLRELLVPEPAAGAGKLIRVKEDVKVDLDGRPTVIRGGTIAPFKELNDGLVTFLAGDHEISISMEHVTFTGASKEKPADITRLAQEEVMRRYPKLKDQDSRENILFVTRVKELQLDPEMKVVFFEDPKWPLVLAEQLAAQENWKRADLGEDEAEAPVDAGQAAEPKGSEIPANEMPAGGASESLLPANAPPIPQEAEPPPVR